MTKKKRKRPPWNEPGCTAQQQLGIPVAVYGTFGAASWKKYVAVQMIIIGVGASSSLLSVHHCGGLGQPH
ncbi:hypothetical protein B9L19_08745 [Geobacillus thermocatenulatus]|uniref:Uncharacterized protein n=1 Tax=Geobacillus thermocatenulatus TaxID=33938 RepID=A0AA91TGS0_9BACL|nr:hypothetical protein B9L19_08745 [Geobacillus thermocatenulatus]